MNRRLIGACGVVAGGIAAILPLPIHADPKTASPAIPAYRYDIGHSGYVAGKIDTPLALAWKRTTALARLTPASFTYKDGVIYVAGGPVVYALSVSDGRQIWRFPAVKPAANPFYSTPVIDGDAVYIGGDDQHVYKLELATGKQVWSHAVSSEVRAPVAVIGTKVFVGVGDGTFYALNTSDGSQVWSQLAGGPITTPASDNGTGEISFAASDNKVYCLDEATGRMIWSSRLKTDATASPPVYSDGTFYAGAGRELYALAERRGNVKWVSQLNDDITTPVAVSPGMLYLATAENRAYGLSDRGRPVWAVNLPYPTIAPPLVVGDTVIFGCAKGAVGAYEGTSGKLLWQYIVQPTTLTGKKLTTTDVSGAPFYVDNTLLVMSDDGSINAFRASAADNTGPTYSELVPAPGTSVNGKNIAYSADVVDEGSGVKPDTVSLQVDGKAVPAVKYIASANGLEVTQSASADTDPVETLSEGSHTIVITATDWRGNKSKISYGFVVDNSKKPVNRRNRGGYPGGPGGYPGGGPGGYPGGGPGGFPGGPGGFPGGPGNE